MPVHFRIFLASPFDVSIERQTAFEVIIKLPYDPLLRGRVTLEIVAWDGPLGAVPLFAGIDPQSAVSLGLPRPSECDIVVVIVHGRLGTLLPEKFNVAGRHVTGTEWEYEDAIGAYQTSGKPVVLVYRKTSPVHFDLSSGDPTTAKQQVEAVDEFCGRVRANGALNVVDDASTFDELISHHLKDVLKRLLDQPDSRTMILGWLSDGGIVPAHSDLVGFAANKLEEPHLRVLVVEYLIANFDSFDGDDQKLAALARQLMATPHDDVGKAGVQLTRRCIDSGLLRISDLATAAANKKWEVSSAAITVTAARFDSVEVLEVYEACDGQLSYWLPVEKLTDHLVKLSPQLTTDESAKAVTILQRLLANPKQSKKQQGRLRTAIEQLSP